MSGLKFLMLAGVALATATRALPVRAGQLPANPGFETGDGGAGAAAWDLTGAGARETTLARSGTASLRLGGCGGICDATAAQTLALSTALQYEASFYARWTPEFRASQRWFAVEWQDADGATIAREAHPVGVAGAGTMWNFSGHYPLSPPPAAAGARLSFECLGITNGAYCVDDVALQPVPFSELRNIGFEGPLASTNLGNWRAGAGAARVATDYASGSLHAMALGGAGATSGAFGQRIAVTPSAVYKMGGQSKRSHDFPVATSLLQVVWYDLLERPLQTNDVPFWSGAGWYNVWDHTDLMAPAGAAEAEISVMCSGLPEGAIVLVDDVWFIPSDTHVYRHYRASGTNLLNPDGLDFVPRGFALSGWFMPEPYMFGFEHAGTFESHTRIRNRFAEILGSEERHHQFWETYYSNFLTRADIAWFAGLGVNMFRLPISYRDLTPENHPGAYLDGGFERIDRVIRWCREFNLGVVLDMHSVPGGAAPEPSGDPEYVYRNPDGTHYAVAGLWVSNAEYTARTGRTPDSNSTRLAGLWRVVAERYRHEECVVAYELINEPRLPDYPPPEYFERMRNTFIESTLAVREVDTNHVVFVEGDVYAHYCDHLMPPWDGQMGIAFHRYWQPAGDNATYPMGSYTSKRDAYQVPIWCSESGENSNPWFHELVKTLGTNHCGWSIWGWKKPLHDNATAWIARMPTTFQYVVDSVWSNTVDTNRFFQGLMDMAHASASTNYAYRPDFVRALMDTNFGSVQLPYADHALPGRIPFSQYDSGNQGVAYQDTVCMAESYPPARWNEGMTFRNDGVDVDVSRQGDGTKVGWTQAGEWMEYTVNIRHAGFYDCVIRGASDAWYTSIVLRVTLDDTNQVIGDNWTIVPPVYGWGDGFTAAFTNANREIAVTGIHTLRVALVSGSINLVDMDFSLTQAGYVDYDADSMNDHWELAHGGDLQAGEDVDGDRAANYDEYVTGTDPADAGSVFQPSLRVAGSPLLEVPAATGCTYDVFRRTNLLASAWECIHTNVSGTGQLMSLPDAGTPPAAFYQVRVIRAE